MNRTDQIRQQAYDIEMRAIDTEILLRTIMEKLDVMHCEGDDAMRQVTTIYCFVTCAMRNVQLLKEHNEHILALTSKDPQEEATPALQNSWAKSKGEQIAVSEKVGA